MDIIKELWNRFYNWVEQEPLTAGAIGSLLATLILAIVFLPARILKRLRSKPVAFSEYFPFERVKPKEFGQWLLDKRRLTCYENPYVPKEIEVIYTSGDPHSHRRKIFLGAAEIGKTRAAYEWVCKILQDAHDAEICIPTGAGLPNPIKEEHIPALAETVVLFYDDLHTSLLPTARTRRESEERLLSPEERFEDLIELFEKRCTNLYIFATARWEHGGAVQSIERYQGIWKTFEILTLKDALLEREAKMITNLAAHLRVELVDDVVDGMAKINKGNSYENTVLFLQNWKDREEHPLGIQNLETYAQTTSARWEREVFEKLYQQNKLIAQLIGAMYTLRFEFGLPLYERFVLRSALISTNGCFRERRLHRALRLLCERGGFRKGDDMLLCYDFQLEISARISPSVQDCLNRLRRCKYMLSTPERYALAELYFNYGFELHEKGNLEVAATAWEQSVSLRREYQEAYYNWGNSLSDLARLRDDERLFEQSFQKYQRAVEIKPDDHGAYYNWGNALADLARLRDDEKLFELSFQKYQRAIQIKPDKHEAYNNWGNALADLARLRDDERLFEQSFQKYQRAVEIKPDKHGAYYNWGNALADLARLRDDEKLFELSFQKYQRAVEIKPDKHEAYNNWGNSLSDLAKLRDDERLFELSFQKYQRAVEIKPDKHEAYNNWGNSLSDLAKLRDDERLFELSFQKYQRAVEIKPDKHEAYNNWGIALADLAELRDDERLFELSFQKYQRAIQIKPDFHEAYYNWGIALADLAKLRNNERLFEQSIKQLQRAAEINPGNWVYHFNLARCYAQQQNAEKACESLERAFSLFPGVIDNVLTASDFDPIRGTPVFQEWLQRHAVNG